MWESRYLHEYLEQDTHHRLTVGVFLRHRLRSTDTIYSLTYCRALTNSLQRRVAFGDVVECLSVRGGKAYRWS